MSALVARTAETEVTETRATRARSCPWYLWPVRFLLDRNLEPSATRIFAFGVLGSNALGHAMDPWTVGLLESALFGYSAFTAYSNHTELKASASGVVNVASSWAKSKVESIQKTFTYTATGEPAHSLPAQPDARTPGGDE